MPAQNLPGKAWRIGRRIVTVIALTIIGVQPVAAQETAEECTVPPDLKPLIDLMDTLSQLAFVGGISLATIGFLIAAILILLPGQDRTRRGKKVAENVFYGTILLLSADMVVSFLSSQVAGTTCV